MAEKHSHAAVDYESIPDRSMWGQEDDLTRKAIERIVSGGKWLNLAASDGRFNHTLLAHSDQVIA